MLSDSIIKQIVLDTISLKFGYVIDARYKYMKFMYVSSYRKIPISEIISVQAQVLFTESSEPVKWKFDLPVKKFGSYDLNICEIFDEELIFEILSEYYSKFNYYPGKFMFSTIGLEILAFLPKIELEDFIQLYNYFGKMFENERYSDHTHIRIACTEDNDAISFYHKIKIKACCHSYDKVIYIGKYDTPFMIGFNYNHSKYTM